MNGFEKTMVFATVVSLALASSLLAQQTSFASGSWPTQESLATLRRAFSTPPTDARIVQAEHTAARRNVRRFRAVADLNLSH